jgi:hypothetical protein
LGRQSTSLAMPSAQGAKPLKAMIRRFDIVF